MDILFSLKIYDEKITKELEELLKLFLETEKVVIKKDNYYLSGGIIGEEYFNILLSKLIELKRQGKLNKCLVLPASVDDIPLSVEKIQVIEI